MIRAFDYVYYRTCKFYDRFSESAPWVFGIGALIISQYCVMIVIDRINFHFNEKELFMKGRYGDFILISIIVFDVVRYLFWKPYTKLQERWKQEDKRKSIVGGMLVLLYLFGSLTGMLYFTGFFNTST